MSFDISSLRNSVRIAHRTVVTALVQIGTFETRRSNKFRIFSFCPSLSAQSSKTSGFNQDFENNQELIDCGPVGMHRKSLEAAEHLKSGGEDSGNDHNGSGSSPHHNHHQGGPTSSESGQESQDGMGPSSSTSKSRVFLPRQIISNGRERNGFVLNLY